MTLFGVLLFGMPLILGVTLIVGGRFLPESLRKWIIPGSVGGVLCCLLVLFFFTGTKLILFSQWWPGSGALYLKFDLLGLMPAFWTTASGLIFYLLDLKERRQTCIPDGLFLVVLTAANLAFLAGNFVLRYAALEVAALGIAIVQLQETGKETGQHLYFGLRAGDAGLLAAILILYTAGGSLEISKALALDLPAVPLVWVVGGFLLAVWVKTGNWPFIFWQNAAAASPSLLSRAWFLATVMPNLGFYLLYRTAPLMAQSETVRNFISIAAAGSALAAMLLVWRKKDFSESILLLFAFQGSITLFAAVHRLDALTWGSIPVASLLRFIFFGGWRLRSHSAQSERFAHISGGLILGLYVFFAAAIAKQRGSPPIVTWVVEASLALLALWFANQWREIPEPGEQGRILQPANHHKWQGWGFTSLISMLFIFIPLLFTPLNHRETLISSLSFSGLSLFSLPVISPSFWILLIGLWGAGKLNWLEKIERPLTTNWQNGLAAVRHVPERIYNFVEIFLYQKGLKGAVSILFKFSSGLYGILEKTTFETGLHLLVKGTWASSTMLRRMHTGRLRINLMWIVLTMALALAILLGAGG